MRFLAELAIAGLLVGPLYALVALGLTLIYKSSSVVNFAQGTLVMLAAYVAWAITRATQHLAFGVIGAAIALVLVGLGVERLALRRMIGQPLAMILMLTIGLEILLRGVALTTWGPETKPFPVALSPHPLDFFGIHINRTYLFGGLLSTAAMAALTLFFRSRVGIRLRAVSDDPVAAWAVGISVEQAVATSWALAGLVATAGGLIWAAVQGVDWTLSHLFVKALAVAILGGLDSIAGVFVAGLLVGILETVISGYLDPVTGGGTKEVVAMLVILVTILIRPHGLFGREIIERI